MRRLRVTKIMDAVVLSDSADRTNIKYTTPQNIREHDFNLDVGFFVINGGTGTDLDIHMQYGVEAPNDVYTIEAKTFSGSGLDDMTTSGTYKGKERARYKIEVDGTGATDTFKWSKNDGETFEATTVDMTIGTPITLENGVVVTFAAKTGHTVTDFWYFTVSEILWDGVTTKAIDAMDCNSSQKYEAETFKPCQWVRFWVDNQDGTKTSTVTLYLITQLQV